MDWFWMRGLLLAVFLACFPSSPAMAGSDFLIGKQLLAYCEQPMGSKREAFCEAYIAGVWGAMWSTAAAISGKKLQCPQIPLPKMVDTVRTYLKDNPEQQRYGAASTAGAALGKSYPCRPQ